MDFIKNNPLYQSAQQLLKHPAARQSVFLVGLSLSISLGIGVYHWIQEPLYRPLEINSNIQDRGTIVDLLEKENVSYKMDQQNGAILIPAENYQMIRMKLAGAGVLKEDDGNFNFLNDKESIGVSHFVENARYLKALEGDLAKTITTIKGVMGAKVHIAIPREDVFADSNSKPTASVLLKLAPAYVSDRELIRAVVQMVAASIPDLDPKDVAITDQYGHYLSSSLSKSDMFQEEELNYQKQVQEYYEKRIESMITPLIGDNKVNVRVHAAIDFSQNEQANEEYSPDEKAVRSEQSLVEQGSGQPSGGIPGALSNQPPSSDDKQSQSPASGNSRNQSVKNYELDKKVTYTKSNYAKIQNLSVAVVVDDETGLAKGGKKINVPLTKDKMDKLNDLVKAAIGFSEERGDKVTVINSTFADQSLPLITANNSAWNQPWFYDLLIKIFGITTGLAVIFILGRKIILLQSNKRAVGLPIAVASQNLQLTNEESVMKNEQLNTLKQIAHREPTKVAGIIKEWINK
jgi:flagellar M-ring protein FliF